ncbi:MULTISPECIES: helix-turn-helix domain-containing protein [Novosphingobium]|jgi:transcriptional regulator with XRE-family HTH domain|uniref:Transcriptional regulator, contains XRE-family HTH domain n=1 Tax=Novosphingobium panipatense TaxID=428991 RepID=A0ABY1QR70_9SPHN|nr:MULTISPECIES: helix-turn-helix domain-containing protein [Novosphingobium]SMP78156.1 Transcriptional regulator, contains XRE-family HTH domain [Novosphingobium panipatense]
MPIAAHFETMEAAGKPRAERRRLLLETKGALENGEAVQVILHNFSETGVLLESKVSLEIGEALELDLPEAPQTRARVIWASGALYGCAFEGRIPSATLRAAQLRSAVQTELGLGAAPTPAGPSAIGGESLGERLHRLRKLRGLTQGELAARLGVSKPTVWAWEQGRARPIEDRLDAIAEALGVEAADLRSSRAVPGLTDLITRCREQIAAAVETTPDKVRIMIEL